MVINVFKGILTYLLYLTNPLNSLYLIGLCDANNGDCTVWKDSFWEDLDNSNEKYNECFYHSESNTHFQDDQDKWTSIGALVTHSLTYLLTDSFTYYFL